MDVENLTSSYFFLGGKNYRLAPGATLEVPDAVYNSDDLVAAAINGLDTANHVTVSSPPSGYPRSLSSSGLSQAEVESLISTHSSDTTAVHGITDANESERRIVQVVVTPPGTAPTTGDAKAHFVIPPDLDGYNLVDADAAVTTVSSSGVLDIAVRRERSGSAVDMLSTDITIDASEKTSYTAATAPVINASNDDVATGDLILVDVDAIGTGSAGLIVVLVFAPV